MMKKHLKPAAIIAACCLAAALSTGCTTKMTTKLHGELQDEALARADSLHAEQIAALTAMQSKLIEEQNRLLAGQKRLMEELSTTVEMLRLLRADQLVRFNEMGRQVSAIESNVFESQSKLSKLDQKTSEVGRRLEEKLASDEEAAQQRRLQLEKLADIAMSDFNAGRYDLAISGFRDLMKQFPEAPQATDAEYWVAESYYAKKEYEAAEKGYFEFVKKYQNHNRYCVALYKLGLAYEYQEKVQSRDMIWKNLLSRCGNTAEAQAVRAAQGLPPVPQTPTPTPPPQSPPQPKGGPPAKKR